MDRAIVKLSEEGPSGGICGGEKGGTGPGSEIYCEPGSGAELQGRGEQIHSQSQGGGVSGSLRIYQKRLKPRWLLLSSREEQNRFIVKAQVGEETFAEGIALTKRAAREAAAQLALVEIQRRGEQIHSQSQGGGVSGSLRIYQKRLKPRWLLLSSREEQNSSLDSFRPIESLALRQRSSEPLSVIRESV
ncbi:hypothetical protein Q8A67_024938 [Cirrhinus molitorella]|uniref:DRBM domain-containing protein n=1 Tax=Cirrhinus molitorella TaxID=172907 RepID=A0AA88NTP9_9TELE|nr:hypothetical protein Q8A67_024938 [Cirrhinus molitorella]